jgi:hypothetical protein
MKPPKPGRPIHKDEPHDRRIGRKFRSLGRLQALVLAGSTTTSLADEGSDYDLCAYTREATLDGQTPEQVGKTQVCAAVEAQPRLGINGFQAHDAHQATDSLVVDRPPLRLKSNRQPTHTVKGRRV